MLHPKDIGTDNPKLSMIVAASENNVIGVGGDLPWRLSADLKRFKRLTMGHHIIMGRKTFESIGRLLPGRTTVIVTRSADFKFEGAKIANSIAEAISICREDDCPFVTGGAEIYSLAMPWITEIQLTRVHSKIAGDTVLPKIDWSQWNCIEKDPHSRDPKNNVDYTFEVYRRSQNAEANTEN